MAGCAEHRLPRIEGYYLSPPSIAALLLSRLKERDSLWQKSKDSLSYGFGFDLFNNFFP